jgi:hypothetical protein
VVIFSSLADFGPLFSCTVVEITMSPSVAFFWSLAAFPARDFLPTEVPLQRGGILADKRRMKCS